MLNPTATNGAGAAPYLRNADVQWGIVNTNDLPTMAFDARERAKFSLRRGDLLVCEGGDVGRSAIWNGELAECYFQKAVHRVRPLREGEDPRFLYYLMRGASWRGEFLADGNKSTIAHLPAEKLRATRLPFPPASEQRTIADFLDRKTASIDSLIEKKERLFSLVEEQRHATICALVTRGLDPTKPLRESGHQWIGAIPAHWDLARTRHVARLESGHTPSRQHPEYWVPAECTIPWVSLADVWQIREGHTDFIRQTAENVSPVGIANSAARVLPAGTVVVSRTASVGFSAIIASPMATTQDFVNWVSGPRLRPKYLLYVFRAMRNEFRRLTMGSTHQTIYMPDVAKFVTPVPPLAEQDAIMAEIDRRLAAIDALASAAAKEIDLLREYRQELITAVVSGQLNIPAEEAA